MDLNLSCKHSRELSHLFRPLFYQLQYEDGDTEDPDKGLIAHIAFYVCAYGCVNKRQKNDFHVDSEQMGAIVLTVLHLLTPSLLCFAFWLHLQHVEILGLGIENKLAVTQAVTMLDP